MASACEENKGKIRSGAEIIGTSNRSQVYNLEEKNNTLYVCSFDRGRWKWVPLKKISQKNNFNQALATRLDLIAYADGKMNLFEISLKIRKRIDLVLEELKILNKNKVIDILK